MTRQEFVTRHQREIMGLLLEAALGRRSGAEAWTWTMTAAKAVQQRLGEAYDDLMPTEPKPATPVAPTLKGK